MVPMMVMPVMVMPDLNQKIGRARRGNPGNRTRYRPGRYGRQR
jgi:hypothetical protein